MLDVILEFYFSNDYINIMLYISNTSKVKYIGVNIPLLLSFLLYNVDNYLFLASNFQLT